MASTVLSGSSNPSYRNNTGENVRIVINYMASDANNVLSVGWAGVAIGGQFPNPTVIGRNLAFSNIIERSASGGISQQFVTTRTDIFFPGTSIVDRQTSSSTITPVATGVDVEISQTSQNMSGSIGSFPTELILSPGQTFTCICGVHNIVVIPENG
jgi:hypothetical protein